MSKLLLAAAAVWTSLWTPLASAQQIDLSVLDKLSGKANNSVNITLDEDKLKFASGFLSNEDADQANAKNLTSKLKAINVRVFEFDSPGQFVSADLDSIRAQLRGPGWSKIVEAKQRDESAEIYMFSKAKDIGGFMIIAAERRQLVVVNIVGPVDLKDLQGLGGKFGIPRNVINGTPMPPPPPAKK